MAIQNDNTLVTKGDLKELYTDKIAPYLGGGINYYHTDRTGEELKTAYLKLASDQSIAANAQNVTVNFVKDSGDLVVSNNGVVIPNGIRVQIDATLGAIASNAIPNFYYGVYNGSTMIGSEGTALRSYPLVFPLMNS